MIKAALTSCILLSALMPIRAQDLYPTPVLMEEMELSRTEIVKKQIKKVTLMIENSVEGTSFLKWIGFNSDGTVSEYVDYNDHRKYNYDYDEYGRLKLLETIDFLSIEPGEDTVISSFSHSANKITEEWIGRSYRNEWLFNDSVCTVLLRKTNFRLGLIYSTNEFTYTNDKLVSDVFERDERIFSKETFNYNQQGLLVEQKSVLPWNNYRDSTVFYYSETMILDSTRAGHYRGGREDGLLADWQTLTLFNENGAWYKRSSFSKDGSMLEWRERFFSEQGNLIKEDYYDLNYEERIVTTYTYDFYD